MKQYDVEISAMACFGYTCWRLFMTEVKRREPSSTFDGGGAGLGFAGVWVDMSCRIHINDVGR